MVALGATLSHTLQLRKSKRRRPRLFKNVVPNTIALEISYFLQLDPLTSVSSHAKAAQKQVMLLWPPLRPEKEQPWNSGLLGAQVPCAHIREVQAISPDSTMSPHQLPQGLGRHLEYINKLFFIFCVH